jgi:hypothetical protein
MNIKLILIIGTLLAPTASFAETHSTYEGKIKSIYLHERDSSPYFGVELEGSMDKNPCGTSLKIFIKNPEDLNDRHLSMLLAAHASGKNVEIRNADSTEAKKCHSAYSTFNFVRVK